MSQQQSTSSSHVFLSSIPDGVSNSATAHAPSHTRSSAHMGVDSCKNKLFVNASDEKKHASASGAACLNEEMLANDLDFFLVTTSNGNVDEVANFAHRPPPLTTPFFIHGIADLHGSIQQQQQNDKSQFNSMNASNISDNMVSSPLLFSSSSSKTTTPSCSTMPACAMTPSISNRQTTVSAVSTAATTDETEGVVANMLLLSTSFSTSSTSSFSATARTNAASSCSSSSSSSSSTSCHQMDLISNSYLDSIILDDEYLTSAETTSFRNDCLGGGTCKPGANYTEQQQQQQQQNQPLVSYHNTIQLHRHSQLTHANSPSVQPHSHPHQLLTVLSNKCSSSSSSSSSSHANQAFLDMHQSSHGQHLGSHASLPQPPQPALYHTIMSSYNQPDHQQPPQQQPQHEQFQYQPQPQTQHLHHHHQQQQQQQQQHAMSNDVLDNQHANVNTLTSRKRPMPATFVVQHPSKSPCTDSFTDAKINNNNTTTHEIASGKKSTKTKSKHHVQKSHAVCTHSATSATTTTKTRGNDFLRGVQGNSAMMRYAPLSADNNNNNNMSLPCASSAYLSRSASSQASLLSTAKSSSSSSSSSSSCNALKPTSYEKSQTFHLHQTNAQYQPQRQQSHPQQQHAPLQRAPLTTSSSVEASSIKSSKRFDDLKCWVCGENSSGNHYGALTCEACKLFFRRHSTGLLNHTNNNNNNNNSSSSSMEVEANGSPLSSSSSLSLSADFKHMSQCAQRDCHITVQTRGSCPDCRYRKCIAVGMGLNRTTFGRHTSIQKYKYNMRVSDLFAEIKRLFEKLEANLITQHQHHQHQHQHQQIPYNHYNQYLFDSHNNNCLLLIPVDVFKLFYEDVSGGDCCADSNSDQAAARVQKQQQQQQQHQPSERASIVERRLLASRHQLEHLLFNFYTQVIDLMRPQQQQQQQQQSVSSVALNKTTTTTTTSISPNLLASFCLIFGYNLTLDAQSAPAFRTTLNYAQIRHIAEQVSQLNTQFNPFAKRIKIVYYLLIMYVSLNANSLENFNAPPPPPPSSSATSAACSTSSTHSTKSKTASSVSTPLDASDTLDDTSVAAVDAEAVSTTAALATAAATTITTATTTTNELNVHRTFLDLLNSELDFQQNVVASTRISLLLKLDQFI